MAGTPLNLPALGACSSSVTFAADTTIAPGTSLTVTTTAAAPAGAPSPLPTNPAGSNAPTPILFGTLQMTAGSITVTATSPAQMVTLASTGSCSTYYTAFASGGSWANGYDQPGTLTGLTVTFPSKSNGSGGGATLTAPNTYYVAFVCF